MPIVPVGHLQATLGLNTAPLTAGLQRARLAMRDAGRKMQRIGRTMSIAIALPLLLIGGAAVKMAVGFETSMSKIVGQVGIAREKVRGMKKDVMALSGETGRAPIELADALFFVTSAGLRGADAMDVLKLSAQGAAAGFGEAKVVADLITSAVNAYGIANLSAAEAADILAATIREGKRDATEIAQSMGFVIPVSSELGVSFNEVGAAIAAMSRTGSNASVAVTQLRQILFSILKPQQKSRKAFKDMGTSIEAMRIMLAGEGGLIKLLAFLREKTKTNSEAFTDAFPNVRALAGELDILVKNAKENALLFGRMEDNTGDFAAALKAAAETAGFKFNVAMAEMKIAMIGLGDILLPLFVDIVKWVARAAKTFQNFSDTSKKTILAIAGLAIVAGPVILIFGSLAVVAASITAPILLVGAALVGLIALFAGAAIKGSSLSNTMKDGKRELNVLVSALIKYNDNEKIRSRLISEIQTKYPDFLKNINTEKVTTNELAEALKKYNVQVDKKITEIIREEQITALKEKKLKLQRKEIDLIKRIEKGTKRLTLFGSKMSDVLARKLVNVQEKLEGVGTELADLLLPIDKVFGKKTESKVDSTANAIAGMDNIVKNAVNNMGELNRALNNLVTKGFQAPTDRIKDLIDDFFAIVGVGVQRKERLSGMKEFASEVETRLQEMRQKLKDNIGIWTQWQSDLVDILFDTGTLVGISFKRVVDIVFDKATKLQMAAQLITNVFISLGSSIGEALGGMEDNFATPLQRILLVLADFAKSFGALIISIGTAMMLIPGLQGMGAKFIAGGLALVIIGAAASTAINKSISNKRLVSQEAEAARKDPLQGLQSGGFVKVGGLFRLHRDEVVSLPAGSAVTPEGVGNQGGTLTTEISLRRFIIQLDRERQRMGR